MSHKRKAEFYLLLITAIWGLTFPLVGSAVKSITPMYFVAARFALAAFIMLPFIWRDLKNTTSTVLKYGLLIGTVNFGCYLFQGIGLQTLGSAESAFITSITVVIVPLILLLFHYHKPHFIEGISAIICLTGLYILTGANITAINRGEIFTLLCAVCCAFSIIFTEKATRKIINIKLLVFFQIVFTAVFAIPVNIATRGVFIFNKQTIFALLYCAIFATLIVFYLQAKYQKQTSASKAALIFCAEPIFAVLYSWIFFSENAPLNTLIGGIIIVASIALPDVLKLDFFRSNKITATE
ncbi:MAG: EamA family transporter [Gammaproteobacteria bacterium]|nr:EamA family transporter [Gammaproteobacteria bacterium]